MDVPRQRAADTDDDTPLKGAAARTHALMVSTATGMMRRGLSPSVSEVAEEAGVSRSTAYRYFPTLADMLRAVVAEALGPILDWDDNSAGDSAGAATGRGRVESLFDTAFPRLFEHEATFRAALRQSLEPGTADATLGRGHRRQLLRSATRDLDLPRAQSARLNCALSLTFGVEAMVVLKDICGLDDKSARDTALWAARAMIDAAEREAAIEGGT